jgi:hypothetical protein
MRRTAHHFHLLNPVPDDNSISNRHLSEHKIDDRVATSTALQHPRSVRSLDHDGISLNVPLICLKTAMVHVIATAPAMTVTGHSGHHRDTQ